MKRPHKSFSALSYMPVVLLAPLLHKENQVKEKMRSFFVGQFHTALYSNGY